MHWMNWKLDWKVRKIVDGKPMPRFEKLRAELSWQTNSRMDERSVVSQLEEELTKESQAKRRIQVIHTQLEENLEKSMAALRKEERKQ